MFFSLFGREWVTSIATTVVEQKGIAIAIVVQYTEAIDTVLDLQNHVVAGPVPSVATIFKCDKERRLSKFGFFCVPINCCCGCRIKIIFSMSRLVNFLQLFDIYF